MANILVFGGSNVYGVWDTEGGWVGRLRTYLEGESASKSGIGRHYINYLVYNLGIPANGSRGVLDRVQFEIRQRISDSDDGIIIFDVGKNDSAISKSTGDFRELPSVFSKNIKEIIGLTKIFSKKIIFLGLLPVDEQRTYPVYWDSNLAYRNQDAEKYNRLLQEMCDKERIYFVDIYSVIMNKPNWRNLFEDGLHLNQKGYRLVFEIVKNYLEKNKFIK